MTTDRSETEERILEAARTVFLRRGTAGARMQQIADEASVNKALLHYYFDDKATLAEAVFVRAARDLLPPVIRVLGSDRSLEEKVERVVEIEIDELSANPFLPGYLLIELHTDPGRARSLFTTVAGQPPESLAPDVLDRLASQLERRAASGEIRPIEPEQFVVNLIALCMFPFAAAPMIKQVLALDDDDFRDFLQRRKEALPAFFLAGLRP